MKINGLGVGGLAPAPMSTNDIVSGDTLTPNVQAPAVLIENESNLADLSFYPAGTIAYTAGFQSMWQRNAAGTWVRMI